MATGFLWLELTGKCQLSCVHCYAGSGPGGSHGAMGEADWLAVINEAASLGVRQVQFIGGEPTLHPALPALVTRAAGAGMDVEVFTNLVHVSPALWAAFALPGVRLATSWYSGSRSGHRAVTGRDTFRQSAANIAEARKRGITVRAGIITGITPGQRVKGARKTLASMGVRDITKDRYRQFGRGTLAAPSETCGRCGRGAAAVLPDGSLTPCPMARWLRVGDVRVGGLGRLLGEPLAAVVATLPAARRADARQADASDGPCKPTCVPDSYCEPLCTPGACKPRI